MERLPAFAHSLTGALHQGNTRGTGSGLRPVNDVDVCLPLTHQSVESASNVTCGSAAPHCNGTAGR